MFPLNGGVRSIKMLMHTKGYREQPGVKKQSEADDWLRSALENEFQSSLTEKIENTIRDYFFMTAYRNMGVVGVISEELLSEKKIWESLDGHYLHMQFIYVLGESRIVLFQCYN